MGHFLSLNTSLGCYDTTFFLALWALLVCCSQSPASSPTQINAPNSALCLLLPLLPVPRSPFTCSAPTWADGSQPCPSCASILVRVMEQHDMILEQWWPIAQTLDRKVRQVPLILVPHCPTPPLDFPLAWKIPVFCNFLIKSVQQKSWLFYTVTLMC